MEVGNSRSRIVTNNACRHNDLSLGRFVGHHGTRSESHFPFMSLNDTGLLLLPARERSMESASCERPKPASSWPQNRRLTARLNATFRTCTTMRGRTKERGGVASTRTLKYAWAISGSTMALKRTRSKYLCSKRKTGM